MGDAEVTQLTADEVSRLRQHYANSEKRRKDLERARDEGGAGVFESERSTLCGVGLALSSEESGYFSVVSFVDSEEQVLRIGDIILEVGGENVAGMTAHELLSRLMGPADTYIEVVFKRRGTYEKRRTRLRRHLPRSEIKKKAVEVASNQFERVRYSPSESNILGKVVTAGHPLLEFTIFLRAALLRARWKGEKDGCQDWKATIRLESHGGNVYDFKEYHHAEFSEVLRPSCRSRHSSDRCSI